MTKTCSKCKEELPATNNYFHNNTRSRDGLSARCKSCTKEQSRIYYIENKGAINKRNSAYRLENKEATIAQSKVYYIENKEAISNRHKLWYGENKEHSRRYSKIRYIENRDHILSIGKIWYEANKEAVSIYHKGWYAENKEAISENHKVYREANREHASEYSKLYYRENKEYYAEKMRIHRREHPEGYRITKHNRRARERKLLHTLTSEQWEKAKLHFKNECAYCGDTLPLTQDHFLATNNGGPYTMDNIIPACGSCNSSKGDRFFSSWYPKSSNYSKQRELNILNYLGYSNGLQQPSLV